MTQRLRNPQWIVATLWLTYAAYYLGRVNISPVLEAMALDLDITRAEVGIFGTIFFWMYAIGLFVIGEIGTHVSPRRIITIGLIVIIMTNLAFAFQTSFWMMAILWGINGFAQASGWSPMLRIIAERFDADETKRISTIMPFSYVVGTALTWTLIGIIAVNGQWRIAFWLPAIMLIFVLIFWTLMAVDAPKSKSERFQLSAIFTEIRTLWMILIAASLVGFIYAGSIIWLPSYVESTALVPQNLIGFVAAIMQVIALAGLFIARYLVAASGQVLLSTVGLLVASGMMFLAAFFAQGIFALSLVTLGLLVVNGAVGMIVSSVPVILSKSGRTSSVTGTVNAISSLGSGFAGFSIGFIIDNRDWATVFAVWALCAFVAGIIIWINRHHETIQIAT